MSDDFVIEALRTLTKNEVTALFWTCKELKYEEIATEIMFLSVEMVQVHMSNVYRKLGFSKKMHWTKRREALKNDWCPALMDMVQDPEELQNWPPDIEEPKPDPVTYPLVVYDMAREEAEEDFQRAIQTREPITIQPPPPQPRPNPLRRLVQVGTVLIVLIACLAVAYGGYWIGQRYALAIPTINVTVIPPTQEPIDQPSEVVIVPPPTSVSSPTSAPATQEVIVVTATSPPLTPTSTQPPLPSPTPIPSIFLPFQDAFDLRLGPEWQTVVGTWRVVDGRLTADPGDDWRQILVGDPGWTNYAVDVDVWSTDWFYPVQVIVRAQESGYLAFETNIHDSDFYLFKDGQSTAIAHTENGTYYVPGGGRYNLSFHFRVEVSGDIITAYLNNVKMLQVQDSTFLSGRVGLAFETPSSEDEVTSFDNIQIDELP